MATIREKSPGVWGVRIFTGRDIRGRPTQISRTVRGGKREAQRLAIVLEGGPGRASAGGRTVGDVLDEWVEFNSDMWAPSSERDQRSRVRSIKSDDALARMPVARLSVADVERWHARLRRRGTQDAGIKNQHGVMRAALGRAQRWGWVNANVASLARLRSSRTQKRDAVTRSMCALPSPPARGSTPLPASPRASLRLRERAGPSSLLSGGGAPSSWILSRWA